MAFEVPNYSNGKLNYEAALDPRSREVAELARNSGRATRLEADMISELDPETAEELVLVLMQGIRKARSL